MGANKYAIAHNSLDNTEIHGHMRIKLWVPTFENVGMLWTITQTSIENFKEYDCSMNLFNLMQESMVGGRTFCNHVGCSLTWEYVDYILWVPKKIWNILLPIMCLG